MSFTGTVINGTIVLDGGVTLPDGTRVEVLPEEWAAPPPPTETREEFLESLRQSVADAKAGLGRPARDVLAELRAEWELSHMEEVPQGTVINGTIVLDGGITLPEGAIVEVQLKEPVEASDDDELWDEMEKMPVPPPTETREEFLESIRQSYAETLAGVPGLSLEEVMAMVDAELAKYPATQEK